MAKVNYKRHTRPCVYYQTDTCPFSAEECDYSHVMATPEQLATMKAPQDTLRTKPCRFFVAGNCKDAVWCRFKHPAYIPATSFCEPKRVDDDAQKVNVPEVERASGLDGCLSAHSEQPTYEDIPDIRDVDKKWKTRLEHHPKYRTRPCRNYLLGKCPYGSACSYLHVAPTSAPATVTSTKLPTTPPPPVPATATLPSSTTDAHIPNCQYATFNSPTSARSTTPSSTIASAMDEPVTPASYPREALPMFEPAIAMASGLPAYPDGSYHLPMMSPGACGVQYATYPASPISMAVMRVPFALPAMRNQHTHTVVCLPKAPPPTPVRSTRLDNMRPRSVSHNHAITPRSIYFKTKPCRFFNENGRCVKGDRCNFIHGERAAPGSPISSASEPIFRSIQTPSNADSVTQTRCETPSTQSTAANMSGNFYKINWRVVGGGVKVASENSPRRHSEDPTQVARSRHKVNEHARGREMSCVFYPRSPLGDAYTAQHVDMHTPCSPHYDTRVHSPSPLALPSPATEVAHVPPLLPSLMSIDACVLRSPHSLQRGDDVEDRNALSLSLQSYTLRPASPNVPTIQGPHDVDDGNCDKLDWAQDIEEERGEEAEEEEIDNSVLLGATRVKLSVATAIMRSKSSPSSPVCAPRELPKLFSAESP